MKSEPADWTKVTSEKLVRDNLSEYGKYVIEERAIAHVFDGMKPVQRRILWTAWERLKLRPGSTPKKSARVVGDTLGVFHPHSAESVYQSMVGLTWQRYPLLKGEGNFGDPTAGLGAAAERYTAVSATKILAEVFEDIAVTETVPNYTGEYEEPVYLASNLPLLLMNGSEGIAVGIAANIPPHNLGGLIKALLLVLKASKEVKPSTLARLLEGPDYPEGGTCISTKEEIEQLYATGTGSLTFRCNYSIKPAKGGYTLLVNSPCPYFSVPRFLDQCEKLRSKNKVGWCEGGTKGVLAICFARDREKLVRNVAPLLTRRVRYNWVALDGKKPTIFNLYSYLSQWLELREIVVERSLRARLAVLERDMVREGARLAAVQHLQKTLQALRAQDPSKALQKTLHVTEEQAKIILDSPISLLTKLGVEKQRKTVDVLKIDISVVKHDLKDIAGVIERDLKRLRAYADERRTRVPAYQSA